MNLIQIKSLAVVNLIFKKMTAKLSKAFDCLLHDLLIAKLYVFGFDFKSLRFIHALLNDRIQAL